MRCRRWVLPVATILAITACADREQPLPTEAQRFSHLSGFAACDATLASQISASIDALLSGQQRSRARREFGDVESNCVSNLTTARVELMQYIKYMNSVKAQLNSSLGTQLQQFTELAANFDKAFVFVGYGAPSDVLPAGAQMAFAFTDSGAAGVFRDGVLLTATGWAGLNAGNSASGGPYAGSPAERLWLIVPIVCPSNLGLTGLCFDFSVHPFDGVNSQLVVAGLCPLNNNASFHARGELAHEFDVPTSAIKVRIPKKAGTVALDCHSAPVASLDPADSWWELALDRVGTVVARMMGPKPLYALHGGLHGTLDTRSGTSFSGTQYGVFDPLIFSDDFENDVVGQPPASPDIGETLAGDSLPRPWTIISNSPSAVTVQASLGNIASKLAVLNQGGGAAGSSFPLTMFARVRGDAPNQARVAARWVSLNNKPTVGVSVPIVLRSFDGTEVVASVEYRRGSNAKSGPFAFNGVLVPGVTWRQGVAQFFEVTIDLDTDVTELRIGANAWPGTLVATSTTTAANVGRIGIELTGQDNQILGFDRPSIFLVPAINP